jgi:uncharacterized protein (TIGR00251 family)
MGKSGTRLLMPAFTATATGTRITLRIQPRASRTEIMGLYGEALRVRVAAPPVEGAANDALLRFLADRLGVGQRSLALDSGHSGRTKTILVTGMAPAEVEHRLRSTR